MSDATLIEDLIMAGVPAPLVGRVHNALLSGTNVRDIARTYERDRKREQRKTHDNSGRKQTMSARGTAAEKPETVPDNVPDIGEKRSDLLPVLSSSLPSSSGSREKKGTTETRARGTRMVEGQTISETDRQFARDFGWHDTQIAEVWTEFVDYWIGIPGQRGSKSNWPATWRNRVKQVGKNGHSNRKNGTSHSAGRAATGDAATMAGMGRIADRIRARGHAERQGGEAPEGEHTAEKPPARLI